MSETLKPSLASYTQAFLNQADPHRRKQCEDQLSMADGEQGWAVLQQAFLKMVDDYLEIEMSKPAADNFIYEHEAGGQLRIGFPHLAVRGNRSIADYMKQVMEARKAWSDTHQFHGYHNGHEVHHWIESFIYFQIPLFYAGLPGSDLALASIEDVAHHIGNWEAEVPDWYDWNNSAFLSTWLGTKEVRNYPPYDYQEANHFRFIDVANVAYIGTGHSRYLELAINYCNKWCDHIEKLAAEGHPIVCSILPEGAMVNENGAVRAELFTKNPDFQGYRVFYTLVAENTAYDVVGGLLDAFRLTGIRRYLHAAEKMIDQFFENGANGRPAEGFKEGKWWSLTEDDIPHGLNFIASCTFIARLALRYDLLTGADRYRERVLRWASAIDEERNPFDQMMANVLAAAHYYDGNPNWLKRAYAMALRTAAVMESNDQYHQCDWTKTRQGTKVLMELLYHPLTGGAEWGTRGNLPQLRLRHQTDGREGLPEGVSFRIWRLDQLNDGFEAVNASGKPVEWTISGNAKEVTLSALQINNQTIPDNRVRLQPNSSARGRISWRETEARK